jgi:hypothetical protein
MKRLTIIAALVLATAAAALPPTASAVWTDNHEHLPEEGNAQLHAEGSMSFTFIELFESQINCTTVTMAVQLTGGQTVGHITSFGANNVQTKCHTNNGNLSHCTVTTFQAQGLPWAVYADNIVGVEVAEMHIATDLHGFLCPDTTIELDDQDYVRLKGVDGEEVSSPTTIDSFAVQGIMTATPLTTPMPVSGELFLTPEQQDRYGWT